MADNIYDLPVSSPGFVHGTPDWVKPIIEKASKDHGVPTIVLSALLKQESGFNTQAKSPAGASGIAQFMPATAKGMGVDPMNPDSAIDGAARYIANNMKRFGKLDLALAAYNAGGGAVNKFQGIPPYPETQKYVKSILGMVGEPLKSSYQPTLDLLADAKKQMEKSTRMPAGATSQRTNPFQTANGQIPPPPPMQMAQQEEPVYQGPSNAQMSGAISGGISQAPPLSQTQSNFGAAAPAAKIPMPLINRGVA